MIKLYKLIITIKFKNIVKYGSARKTVQVDYKDHVAENQF